MIILGGILGVFLFLVGLVYFFYPRVIVHFNEWGKKILFRDEWTIGHRLGTGLFFLIIGFFVIYCTFFFK